MAKSLESKIKALLDAIADSEIEDDQKGSLSNSLTKVTTEKQLAEIMESFSALTQDDVKSEPTPEPTSEPTPEPTSEPTSTIDVNPVDDFEGFLSSDTDAQEYLALCTITGKNVIPAHMGEYEIKSWIADMNQWVSEGKPKANMPKVKRGVVKFATAIYRIRDAGKDKMYCYLNDGTVAGIKETVEYDQVENISTGELEDSKTIKNRFNAYTKLFDSQECQEIIKESEKLMRPGQTIQLYFWFNGSKKPVSSEKMLLSYDELSELVRSKKPLN